MNKITYVFPATSFKMHILHSIDPGTDTPFGTDVKCKCGADLIQAKLKNHYTKEDEFIYEFCRKCFKKER
jgi:hypothetical protein